MTIIHEQATAWREPDDAIVPGQLQLAQAWAVEVFGMKNRASPGSSEEKKRERYYQIKLLGKQRDLSQGPRFAELAA